MIYDSILVSKTGLKVPVFKSNRPCHSKYDPLKEAQQFISQISQSDIFIVIGIGGAYHIDELQKKFPFAKIIAFENTQEDIDFLETNIDLVKTLKKSHQISFFSAEQPQEIETAIFQNYIPSVYPTLSVLEWRSWKNECPDEVEKISKRINETIENIAQDFATQAKFGKIWQHNILKNISLLQTTKIPDFPTEKTALVLAAGPSLEKNIDYIKKNRNEFYIISTDTAYLVMRKNNIFCDVVVSIDGQQASSSHFLGKIDKNSLFVFDVCANPSASRKIYNEGGKIIFSHNGHPLAQYIEKKSESEPFFHLNAGAGTVTISCINFALEVGFKKITLCGADFGYIKTKTYSSGTYFDAIYATTQSKITSFQKKFIDLYLRSPLIEVSKEKQTNALLESYRKSFENWAKINDFEIFYENSTGNYILCSKKDTKNIENLKKLSFGEINTVKLKKNLTQDCKIKKSLKNFRNSEILTAMLPFISYLRGQKNNNFSEDELVNLAIEDFMMYTILL